MCAPPTEVCADEMSVPPTEVCTREMRCAPTKCPQPPIDACTIVEERPFQGRVNRVEPRGLQPLWSMFLISPIEIELRPKSTAVRRGVSLIAQKFIFQPGSL